MSKKEFRKQREDWRNAVRDGRVLRFHDNRLKSYPTIAMRNAAYREAKDAGYPVEVVSG